MREYPKMLYIGTVQTHKHQVAQNGEHEAELRELGFVDFADLKKEEDALIGETVDGGASGEDFKNAFVPVEQFDAVCEELVQKETQLGVAQNERDLYIKKNAELEAELTTAHEANERLQKELASLQPDPMSQAAPVENDYSNATAKEMREALDARGIKYLQRDSVDTLRALLTQPEKTEE